MEEQELVQPIAQRGHQQQHRGKRAHTSHAVSRGSHNHSHNHHHSELEQEKAHGSKAHRSSRSKHSAQPAAAMVSSDTGVEAEKRIKKHSYRVRDNPEGNLKPNYEHNTNKRNPLSQQNSQGGDSQFNSDSSSLSENALQKMKGSQQMKEQKPQKRHSKQQHISQFDRLEEIRFKTYETRQVIDKLAQVVEKQTRQNEQDCFSANFLYTIAPETWDEISNLTKETQDLFTSCQGDIDGFIETVASDLQKYKQRCALLRDKIDTIKSESYMQSKDRQKEYEKSLKVIAHAYDKNRTQIFTVMDEMELAIHDLKNGIEKRNVKQLGYMTQLDKDMDDMLGDFISKSGRLNLGSHRGVGNAQLGSESQRSRAGHMMFHHNNLQQDSEKVTPRSQLSSRRGVRSQQPGQVPPRPLTSQAVDVIAQQPAVESKKVSIPLLPIHMINSKKEQVAQTSQRNQVVQQQQLSSRRKQLSNRLVGQQQLPEGKTPRPIDSKRSNSCLAGERPIEEEYLVNPVFIGAVYQTSQFDKGFENDFDGADETLQFDTDRLKQYEDEYNMLKSLEDEEQKILVKQYLFMIHERELKAQAKQEKLQRIQQKRAQRQAAANPMGQFNGTTPRAQNGVGVSKDNEQTLKEPSIESQNAAKPQKPLEKQRSNSSQERMQEAAGNLSQSLNASHISLQKQLPMLGTLELISARRKEELKDVNLSQILEVSVEIHGLIKTVTEKAIIQKLEQELEQKAQLLKEDRKVLDWSSSGGEEDSSSKQSSKERKNSQVPVVTPIDSQPFDTPLPKSAAGGKQRLYSNGAISIIDVYNNNEGLSGNPVTAGEPASGREAVDEGCEGEFSSSSNLSLNSSEILDQYKQRKQGENLRQNQQQQQKPYFSPSSDEDLKLSPDQDSSSMYRDKQHQQSAKPTQVKGLALEKMRQQQLDVIQERQSEFSSSINTNRFMQKMKLGQQDKSRSRQKQDSKLLEGGIVYQDSNQMPQQMRGVVHSARDTPCAKNIIDFNKLQYIIPQCEIASVRNAHQSNAYAGGEQNTDQQREQKYKRCQSHRNSLQSAPNSQRGKAPTPQYGNKKPAEYIPPKKKSDLYNGMPLYNFHSIQVEEYTPNHDKCTGGGADSDLEDLDDIRLLRLQMSKKKKNSYENSYSHLITMDQEDYKEGVPVQSNRGKSNGQQQQRRYNKRFDFQELQQQQQFSSIQNQFEESKTSSFKNESFDLEEGSIKQQQQLHGTEGYSLQKREAFSDYDYRENEDMCEMEDIDLNNIQIYNKMIPLSYFKEMQQNQHQLSHQKDSSVNPFQVEQQQQQQQQPSITQKSQQQQTMLQFQQSRPLSNNPQMTAQMLANFLQNQTHLKMAAAGQSTREILTCKRDHNGHVIQRLPMNGVGGQTGFTLSTFGGEDTLLHMFPAQKTQRRTLFMLQNFNNNYYNNCAGVLFTMPLSGGTEMNNGFLLPQCQTTAPSDPELCSGGMTIQDVGSTQQQIKTKQIMRNLNHQNNTTDSLIRGEENILQRFGCFVPQFSTKLSLSNKNAALSTNDSALKSTSIPSRFAAQQQQKQQPLKQSLNTAKDDSLMSPKLIVSGSFDNEQSRSPENYPMNVQQQNSSEGKSSIQQLKNNFFQRHKTRLVNHQQTPISQDGQGTMQVQNSNNSCGPTIKSSAGFSVKNTSNSFLFSPSAAVALGGPIQSSNEKIKAIFNRNIKIISNSVQSYKSQQQQVQSTSMMVQPTAGSLMVKKQNIIKIHRNAGTSQHSQASNRAAGGASMRGIDGDTSFTLMKQNNNNLSAVMYNSEKPVQRRQVGVSMPSGSGEGYSIKF